MATIRIRPTFFPLAFILFFIRPRVVLDGGEPQQLQWRQTTDLSVTPGSHSVLVYFPYLIPRVAGKAEVQVNVQEGQTTEVRYRAPLLVFLPGKIKLA